MTVAPGLPPGGAQGIGYGIAEHLASQGAHVVLLDMNDTVLQTGETGRSSKNDSGAPATPSLP